MKMNIITDKISVISDIQSFSNICRTCGTYSTELNLINNVHDNGINLKEIILNWTNLQYKDDDELPKNVCKACIKSIYEIYHFLCKCNTVNNLLNEVLLSKKSLENLEEKIEEKIVIEARNAEITIETKKSENEVNTKRSDKLSNGTLNEIKMKLPKLKRSYVSRQGPPFKCITCDAVFNQYEDLKIHKLETKHRKALKYSCPHCQKRLDVYSKFVEHVRTHTGEKPNKCLVCGKGFNFKTDLRRHSFIHLDIKPYKCKLCNETFSRKGYLRDHERKHTGEKLICLFCGKHFVTYSSLVYHEKIHKGYVRDPLALTCLCRCELCGKNLASEQTLKAHMLLHGPKNFICEICSKTYATDNRLRLHILSTHQKPQFQCNICGKAYKQKYCLEEHLKSHSGENNYNCNLCRKQFLCKSSLQQHSRIHTGDTKYQCKECSRICINRRLLENHMRVHTGEKPYNCEYCGKLFKQKSHVTEHTKIHTGQKNHTCSICGKGFYVLRALTKHIQRVHAEIGEQEEIMNKKISDISKL